MNDDDSNFGKSIKKVMSSLWNLACAKADEEAARTFYRTHENEMVFVCEQSLTGVNNALAGCSKAIGIVKSNQSRYEAVAPEAYTFANNCLICNYMLLKAARNVSPTKDEMRDMRTIIQTSLSYQLGTGVLKIPPCYAFNNISIPSLAVLDIQYDQPYYLLQIIYVCNPVAAKWALRANYHPRYRSFPGDCGDEEF